MHLPPSSVSALLHRLSREPGFLEFNEPAVVASTPTGQKSGLRKSGLKKVSAWPVTIWQLPETPAEMAHLTREIEGRFRELAVPDRKMAAGGVGGLLDYESGRATVPGLRDARARLCSGQIGLYLWEINLGSDSEPGADIRFHPQCPDSLRAKVLAFVSEGVYASNAPADSLAWDGVRITRPFQPLTTDEQYRQGVRDIVAAIEAGDCYQVNFSRRFTGGFEGQPYAAYQNLIREIPVPFSGFFNQGDYQVLSVSPELMLAISRGEVTSKPIKGTRPRSEDPAEDQAYSGALLNSEKDRAENLMIVDLIRNDLSAFCTPHSVTVPKLFDLESYRNVHQMVSTVRGRLRTDVSPLAALLTAFPGGSVTGAPKRMAMEMIRDMETSQRGPYCGSLFWWDFNDNLVSNIAIRTLMTETDGSIHVWGGCGIVADSDAEEELQESVTKIQRLMDAVASSDDSEQTL